VAKVQFILPVNNIDGAKRLETEHVSIVALKSEPV